ncbi:MAG: thiol:disulfide interchange protein DsbA/DsbL [Woeseiaceae bacterium]
MKNVIWIGAAILLMAACSTDDSAPATETAPAVIEEQPAADVPVPATESEQEDDVLEVVEESASEPEPEEQAIVLAQADVPALTAREWQYKENQHYFRLVPTQPTVGGADKIEVAEFFWYGCPHCFDFERFVNPWSDELDPSVRFVRVPAMWNSGLKLHAQLYYTEEVLARNGTIKDPAAFREAVFTEYHRRGNRLASLGSIKTLFARFDVSEDEFDRTWSSFEVSQKLRIADDLARRYGVANVPTMVVNGKYRTGGAEAGSYPKLLEVLDELIARESIR